MIRRLKRAWARYQFWRSRRLHPSMSGEWQERQLYLRQKESLAKARQRRNDIHA